VAPAPLSASATGELQLKPSSPGTEPGPGRPVGTTYFGVRTDRIGDSGSVSLRYDSKMFHIGIGRRFKGTPIRLYIADLDVRVVSFAGELLRHLEIDPSRLYQVRDREVEWPACRFACPGMLHS
jgi:hypothetical protein